MLEPRKQPVQARSAASVEAILQATIQVLLQVGKERLTTTRVAARAGVSVGTLYQYFPNKSALLQAGLRRHLNEIVEAVERVCEAQKGKTLREMATALVNAFLDIKMRNPKGSAALYSVSADVDGMKIALQIGLYSNQAVARMLASSPEPLASDPQLVATMLQGMMAGVSRKLLESSAPEKQIAAVRKELIRMACAYLGACSAGALVEDVRGRDAAPKVLQATDLVVT